MAKFMFSTGIESSCPTIEWRGKTVRQDRFYTPVNEIFVAATFSAQFGWWNERLSSDRAFVTALTHLCQANLMAMHAILKETPDAIFIQSESTQYFHSEGPESEDHARRFN